MTIKEQGSALIFALLITAICAILATAVLMNPSVLIQEMTWIENADQMQQAAQAAIGWSLGDILDHSVANAFTHQLYSTALNTAIPPLTLGSATTEGHLEDADTFFNINSLALTANQPNFLRLLSLLDPDLDSKKAGLIAASISNWMMPNGNEKDYLDHKPPYRPARLMMINITELKKVLLLGTSNPAISDSLFEKLRPLIVALPNKNSRLNINANIAPERLLKIVYTLSNGSIDDAKALSDCITDNKPFKDSNDFFLKCPLGKLLPSNNLTTNSQYYLINTHTVAADQQLFMSALIGIEYSPQNIPYFAVIWQHLN